MILELRILSGMHRGATLTLDDHALVLGSGEDADVVLTDAGCAPQHATLLQTGDGWTLSALDGQVQGEHDPGPQAVIDLAPGELARLGDVWLTVAVPDSAWQSAPAAFAQTADALFDAAAPEQEPADSTAADLHAHAAAPGLHGPSDPNTPMTSFAASQPPTPPVAAPASGARNAGTHSAGTRASGTRALRFVPLPFAIAAILSAAAAYAITASSGKSVPLTATEHAALGARHWGNPADVRARPEAWTMEELRLIFRKRMSDADLLRRFDLQLGDHSWSMQAALDTDEAARFERILASFMDKYNITFPVEARIGSPESMLPFRIGQVISGADASVVTHDGRRMYVGDTYQGVRLVAVRGNNLVFEGKRKIEVAW